MSLYKPDLGLYKRNISTYFPRYILSGRKRQKDSFYDKVSTLKMSGKQF